MGVHCAPGVHFAPVSPTDNRIQSVSVKSQLTSFDSLETIFCCCRCTTKFKENYIPAWMPHRTILFHLRGSPTTFCFHLHGNPVTLASIHAKFPWSAFPCRSLVGTDWLRHQLNWVVLRARQLSVFYGLDTHLIRLGTKLCTPAFARR